MKTLFAITLSFLAMQTLYAGKDFCTTLKSATAIILKKDVKALGEEISKNSFLGVEYKFPVSLYGSRYAIAQVSDYNMLVKQYFDNANKEKLQPVFDNLLEQLSSCGIELKEDRYGGYSALVNDIYYSLEMLELGYDEDTETTNYSVLLTISVKL